MRRAEIQWGEDLMKDAEETRLEQPEHLALRRAADAGSGLGLGGGSTFNNNSFRQTTGL